VRIHGHYDIANKFNRPIEQILLSIPGRQTINCGHTGGDTGEARSPVDLDLRMNEPWSAGRTGAWTSTWNGGRTDFRTAVADHGGENGNLQSTAACSHTSATTKHGFGDDDTRRKIRAQEKQARGRY